MGDDGPSSSLFITSTILPTSSLSETKQNENELSLREYFASKMSAKDFANKQYLPSFRTSQRAVEKTKISQNCQATKGPKNAMPTSFFEAMSSGIALKVILHEPLCTYLPLLSNVIPA